MEQEGVATTPVTNGKIAGVPSDASVLEFLRRRVRRGGVEKRLASEPKSQTKFHAIVSSRHTVTGSSISQRGGNGNTNKLIKKKEPVKLGPQLQSAVTQSKVSTIERQTSSEPAQSLVTHSDSRLNQTLSTSDGTTTHTGPDLLIKNDRIRRILAMVNWTKVRRETVQQVAVFQEPEDAETKFQEFESFIRAEGRNLGLPEGCKPFERVLIRGDKPDSKPCPYISFTNFRTEEDVRRYHAALSKRKVRQQYYPPLRLCYEIQKINYHAASASLHLEGNPGNTLCGKTATIEVDGELRAVTIGGVIQVDNKLYAMTAGHSTTPNQIDQAEPTSSNSNDDVDDSGYDDDIEPALIRGGPNTTHDVQAQFHLNPRNERLKTRMASTTLNFKGSSMTGDDWSLHLVDDPLLALPNSFPGRGGATTRYMTHPAIHPVSDSAWLLAGVSGHREVSMLPGTVIFPLPSGNWIHAWKISLGSSSHAPIPLQQGDSGSWVVDRTNGHVFGLVIASTETSAFLMPLIHVIDAISSQAKLKGPGDVVFLPPAFDTLANLAHAHYNRSTENGQDAARWFASQALMHSTLQQSPASVVAPVIIRCLELHRNLQQPIKDILQKLLTLTGANLKATVTEIWHNGQTESLIDTIDITSGTQRRAAQILIRDLVTGLNILSAGPSGPLWSKWPWESSQLVQAPTGKSLSQAQEMTQTSQLRPQTPHSSDDPEPEQLEKHNWRMDEDRSREVDPLSTRLRHQSSHTSRSPKMAGGLSPSRLDSTHLTQTVEKPKRETARESEKKKNLRQRLRSLCPLPPLTCAVISVIIAALIAAVSVLGAFLGVEVRQNKSLQERLSSLVDVVPTACTTVITSTISVTESVSATASACVSRSVDSCNGLSSGGWYGVGIASGVGIGVLLAFLYVCVSFFRRRMWHRRHPTSPSIERPVSGLTVEDWDSHTRGYNSVPPVLHIGPVEAPAWEPVVEIGPSHRVSSDIKTSGLPSDPARHRHSSARVEDVLQLPDPMAASVQTDE